MTAKVGEGSHTVSLTIEEDGLIVGPFGKLPWAGSQMAVEVEHDGCRIHMAPSPGVDTDYFVPASSFASFGGVQVMKTFTQFLLRSAIAAGAREAQPAA
ncbi:MAG TPA: hypothetical protein VFH70_12615 [Acidimicrobiales bacterium]|nr:hypothetical protein [Acidimicrobiales bacterium]